MIGYDWHPRQERKAVSPEGSHSADANVVGNVE
jgi:hypothetical protein